MKKKISIGIFCAVVYGFTIASILTPETEYSKRENRILTIRADLIFDLDFADTYEEYVSDQFFLRDSWVNLTTGVLSALGKTDINGVYIGEDGYLIERYTEEDFDRELVEYNIDILAEFLNEMTDCYGSDHVDLFLIPAKAGAMPDYLPDYAQMYVETETVKAIRELLTEPKILTDLTETLKAHQDEYIYYRTDHHWTTLGAYYAYEAYAQKSGFTIQPQDSFETEEVTDSFYGTTYNSLQLDVPSDTITLYHSEAEENVTITIVGDTIEDVTSFYFEEALSDSGDSQEESGMYSVFLGGNTEKIVIDTGADTGRTLLLLKDSFANCFIPFLANDFDRIIMIDLRYSDTIDVYLEEYGDEISDLLVLYNIEKFMQDESVDLLNTYE